MVKSNLMQFENANALVFIGLQIRTLCIHYRTSVLIKKVSEIVASGQC